MDAVDNAPRLASRTPRYFWRRAIAYIIDLVIFETVLCLFLYGLSLATPWNLTFPIVHRTQCSPVATQGVLVQKVEAEWPLKPGQERENSICHVAWPGGRGYDFFLSTVTTRNGAATFTQSASTFVDKNGNPVDANSLDTTPGSYLAFLFPLLGFAFYTADGRRTPGKAALSLRVTTTDGAVPDLLREVKREALKFLPFILLALGAIASSVVKGPGATFDDAIRMARDANPIAAGSAAMIGIAVVIFGLVWWLFPLLFWRGQTFYDRLSGCKVVRS